MSERKYRYEVWGWGSFPSDMLRYDRCEIVDKRQRDDKPPNGRDDSFIYTIEGKERPTKGRWESFLWHVKENV
jgi:hypothetical protein